MAHYSKLTVLTGDLIKSTNHEPHELDACFARLHGTMNWLADHHPGDVWFERFRGDGWQVAVEDPRVAVLALSLIWSDLHGQGLHSRIAMAQGVADISGDLASASGPAFVASGHGLEGMDPGETLHLDPSVPAAWAFGLPALDFIAHGWTERQAQVCGAALRGWGTATNVSALSRDLKLSRQTVQKHLEAAGFEAFSSAISTVYPAPHIAEGVE